MRFSICTVRGIAQILAFSCVLLLIPLPWTQSSGPAFDPFGFRLCVSQCQIVVDTCFGECMMGGSPPEFEPAGCLYYCHQFGADCREEVCRDWLPPEPS